MKIEELRPHPLANVFPLMPDDELEHLAADIKQNGLLEPIIVSEDGLVIDGRNRLAACKLAGVPVRYVQYNPDKHGPIDSFIMSKNIHRRQMNKSQIACVVHLMALAVAEQGIGTSYTSALGTLAKGLGVSKRYVDLAAEVRRVDPQYFDAIFEGVASLYDWEKHKKSWEEQEAPQAEPEPNGSVADMSPDWLSLVGTRGKIIADDDGNCWFEYKKNGIIHRCSLMH